MELEQWIEAQARRATAFMLRAISATELLMERVGFDQRIRPHAGSVLASPVLAHYDPEPDYFFHWFRDAAIVIDALRVAFLAGYTGSEAVTRFCEFVQFSEALLAFDGSAYLHAHDLRSVRPELRQYLRPAAQIAALNGESLLADARVNADGTPDVTRWSRPQSDGPALQALTLMRWLPEAQHLQGRCRKVLAANLDFVVAQLGRPSYDIWEEESGQHYYTLLVQAEACTQGALYFAAAHDHARAAGCGAAALDGLRRLEEFWDPQRRFYRSRLHVDGGVPSKELDSAVLLATLHSCAAEVRGVLDPKVQATLAALEELFEASYAINQALPADRAPAMGRYANDRYYSGGAFYFATLGAAEFYYRLSAALARGATLANTSVNRAFCTRLLVGAPTGAPEAQLALRRGDAFMRTVQRYTPAGGELAEQFDQNSGVPSSARRLSWSYAAFITAAASRAEACSAAPASGLPSPR